MFEETSFSSENGALRSLDAAVRHVENVFAMLSGAAALCIMLLVSLDAILRYAFNSPLTFVFTLTEHYLMVVLVMMALPWGVRTGGYINVTAFVTLFPQSAQTAAFRIGMLLSAVYVLLLAYTSWREFLKVFGTGEAFIGVIDWPVWVSWVWVPPSCLLLAIRLIIMCFSTPPWLGQAEDVEEHSIRAEGEAIK